MKLYPVRKSSYGVLAGTTQYVTSAAAAAHVNSLIDESRGVLTGGACLSVNEGVRSRARQKDLRDDWEDYRYRGGAWAALAAVLYTSSHDESKGDAVDFGVTNADGTNRALTMSEHAWVVSRGRKRGLVWTGKDFRPTPESWHFNWYPGIATLAPIDFTPEPIPALFQEEDMVIAIRVTQDATTFKKGDKFILQIGRVARVSTTTLRAAKLTERVVDMNKDEFRKTFAELGISESQVRATRAKK